MSQRGRAVRLPAHGQYTLEQNVCSNYRSRVPQRSARFAVAGIPLPAEAGSPLPSTLMAMAAGPSSSAGRELMARVENVWQRGRRLMQNICAIDYAAQ
jgi:hypothetical protein